MKKKVFGRKLSRERDSRRALFRNLTKALVKHGSIKTTRAKAKAVQPFVDRLVKLGKERSVSTVRRIYADLGNDRETTKKITEVVSPAFKVRNSGYTRIVNLPKRRGDSAKMVKLEWVKEIKEVKKTSKSKSKKETK